MSKEQKRLLAKLTARLTPRGAFEAAHWGAKLPEGRRFIELYTRIRETEKGVKRLSK